jgi:hypothetical protein
MKLFAPPLLATISLLTLAACDGATPESGEDAGVATEETAAAESLPTSTATPEPTASPATTTIPPAIQGRWGMVAADCEPGRDDAKGLLTISATKLQFYESVGTLATITEASDTRIRAMFDFTGEGMTWQRDAVLDVQDAGKTLIRREYGDDAAPGAFRYTKCE